MCEVVAVWIKITCHPCGYGKEDFVSNNEFDSVGEYAFCVLLFANNDTSSGDDNGGIYFFSVDIILVS